MISIQRPLLQCLRTIGHELMHLQFHNAYWDKMKKEIGEEKTSDLNESLITLLNLEFGDLWLVKDEGYFLHQEMRRFIEKEWKKDPNFEKLLENCIMFLKK